MFIHLVCLFCCYIQPSPVKALVCVQLLQITLGPKDYLKFTAPQTAEFFHSGIGPSILSCFVAIQGSISEERESIYHWSFLFRLKRWRMSWPYVPPTVGWMAEEVFEWSPSSDGLRSENTTNQHRRKTIQLIHSSNPKQFQICDLSRSIVVCLACKPPPFSCVWCEATCVVVWPQVPALTPKTHTSCFSSVTHCFPLLPSLSLLFSIQRAFLLCFTRFLTNTACFLLFCVYTCVCFFRGREWWATNNRQYINEQTSDCSSAVTTTVCIHV